MARRCEILRAIAVSSASSPHATNNSRICWDYRELTTS
jgi:hypothetical protein